MSQICNYFYIDCHPHVTALTSVHETTNNLVSPIYNDPIILHENPYNSFIFEQVEKGSSV